MSLPMWLPMSKAFSLPLGNSWFWRTGAFGTAHAEVLAKAPHGLTWESGVLPSDHDGYEWLCFPQAKGGLQPVRA